MMTLEVFITRWGVPGRSAARYFHLRRLIGRHPSVCAGVTPIARAAVRPV